MECLLKGIIQLFLFSDTFRQISHHTLCYNLHSCNCLLLSITTLEIGSHVSHMSLVMGYLLHISPKACIPGFGLQHEIHCVVQPLRTKVYTCCTLQNLFECSCEEIIFAIPHRNNLSTLVLYNPDVQGIGLGQIAHLPFQVLHYGHPKILFLRKKHL
jgi:hypothetical protein